MRHDATEGWFLDRGLPSALTPRVRARHLLARLAPALAAYVTVVVALLAVYFLTGTSEIYIDGAPTRAEQIVLAVIVLVVPLAVLAGWAVSRMQSRRAQSLVFVASVLILCVLTFMYVSARSVGDDEYKADFLDPLIEDLHVTLTARNRYRAELAHSD
jgi:cytochrome bd-type quinol oxidase subunit 2